MSGITAAGVLAAAAVAGVAASVHQGEQARKRANRALGLQKKEADRSFNAANPNRPNAAAMAADNMQAAGAGVASTTLTGAGGAPVSRSSLGSSSLLGG